MSSTLSLTPHIASRAEETEAFRSAWVVQLMLALIVFIQAKMQVLWSDSRMLRKLRTELRDKGADSIRAQILQTARRPCSPDEIVSKLYMRLSKGRHRRIGRLYSHVYIIFTWIFDVVSFLPSSGVALLTSDAVSAFRLSIAAGSLTVLGARPLTVLEAIILLSALAIYIFSIAFVPSLPDSRGVSLTILVLRSALVLSGVVRAFYLAFRQRQGDGTHLSDICLAIAKRTYGPLKPQHARMKHMRASLWREGDTRGTHGGRYWPLQGLWFDVCICALLLISNIGTLGDDLRGQLPAILITEAADFISILLLFLNDTQVEPTLFTELLKIADGGNAARSADLGDSHFDVYESASQGLYHAASDDIV